jgi:hypothetical protein
LWREAGIEFNDETTILCMSCMKKLGKFSDRCPCNDPNRKRNSELVVFSIANELRRVIEANIDAIDWYAQKKV